MRESFMRTASSTMDWTGHLAVKNLGYQSSFMVSDHLSSLVGVRSDDADHLGDAW